MHFGRKTMMGAIGTLVAVGIGLAVSERSASSGGSTPTATSSAQCVPPVHPEESIIHKQSVHARVHCVECHMGRNSTLHLMAMKPTHFNELWGMIVGYERPRRLPTLRPSRDTARACHWPSDEHHDSIALKKRYGTDEKSSETTTRLTLHIRDIGVLREKEAKGIHWHIENEVVFKTPVAQQREIPWVQVKAQ